MKPELRMKILRQLIPLIILVLLFTMGSGASAGDAFAEHQASEPGRSEDFPGLHVQTSTQERIAISLHSPGYLELISWTQAPGSGKASLGDVTFIAEPGTPQLPVYRALVGIPADASYTLNFKSGPSQAYVGVDVPVSVQADTLSENGDLIPGRPTQLLGDELFPSEAIKIVDEAWMRDQRVVVLEFYPLQYLPEQKEVRYHSSMVAELLFDFPEPGSLKPSNQAPELIAGDIYDTALSDLIINYDTAQDWQASLDVAPMVDNFPIAEGIPGLKIVVDHAGIYQITYADLANTGMNLSGIDPAYLHLQNLESVIAYEFLGDGDNQFEAGESIRFYGEPLPGQRLQTMYQEIMQPWIDLCPKCDLKELLENFTNENVYWLFVGDTTGTRIQPVSGAPTDQYPIPEIFTDTQYAEEDLLWYPYHFTSSDVWFWNRVQPTSNPNPVIRSLPVTLGNVAAAGPDARLNIEIVSRINVDHQTRFNLNSAPIMDAYWEGNVRYVFTPTVSLSTLQDGQNLLGWETYYVGSADDQWFDRFQISYAHEFAAVNDRLAFTYPELGTWQYEITGLTSSDAVVYDITDPLTPIYVQGAEITADVNGSKVAFERAQTAPVRMFVAGSASVETPKSITWYQPPELEPVGGADYIFITHRDFLPAIQGLADYRASQGMRTLVVDVADVYDQFGYGIYHPIAIRNYLERAMLTWGGARPEYVLLVGDATFEIRQRDNVYVDEPITMPPALAITDPAQGEMDATNLLAAVIGTDIMPDLAIGRIPAKTAEEVSTVVGKTIAYEQSLMADWQRNVVYIADNTDASGNYEGSMDNLVLKFLPEGFAAEKFYVSNYCVVNNTLVSPCPDITNAIINTLNTDSALFVNYAGHGSTFAWAGGPVVFDRTNVDLLTNKDRLPVILSWTCLDGYFYYPVRTDLSTVYTPSLVEKWLFSIDKGAVASFSSAGLGVGAGHDILATGFHASVFENGNWNLGAASVAAKANLYRAGVFLDLINSYIVFGDPALQIASPYRLSVTPASLNGSATPGSLIHYTITVNNTGAAPDSYRLIASGNNWPVSVSATVGPVAAGSQANITVSVLVPITAASGAMDQVRIDVISKGDFQQTGSVQITTLVTSGSQTIPGVFVPVVFGP